MSAPVENITLTCEQCGRPLQSRAGEADCLHCLLSMGLEESAHLPAGPNEWGGRVFQHYEIMPRPDGTPWELGRGAMGVTYKARDTNLETAVALKVIGASFSVRSDARRRFLHEAKAAAALRHPNVASVYHFGVINTLPTPEGSRTSAEEAADMGDCFYAMEFIEGETLEARIRRSGPLPATAVLEVARQVTRALAAAEKRGLVHRDLKPSNVMLSENESGDKLAAGDQTWIKVIDFGLAKVVHDGSDSLKSERFLGTIAFSSPEQMSNGAVDIRSDIYSLGITVWYALTGEVPFPNRSPGRLENETLPLARLAAHQVPTPIVALLRSMLAPSPEERPASADGLGQAIQKCEEELSKAKLSSGRWAGRHRWSAVAALFMVAVLLGIAFYARFSAAGEKSVAVLPFRNLSQNPRDAFFAEGVQDDLLSRLVKIHDLKVISRLSAARYLATLPRNVRLIGQELGVRHLLEGDLRRSGGRVFLSVALIDTQDGHEVWSEKYDRRLADAINLQGELAGAIAEALDATLSPLEKAGVRATVTRNPDAYVLYLRGRKFEKSPNFAISDFEAAQTLYRQAIALDPGFALAHARLASTLSFLYRFRGPNGDLSNRAYAEAREALRLQPDLGEARLASALCAYRIDRDFDRSMPEFVEASRLLPNDSEAASYVAFVQRRQGHWQEARDGLERCLARDPKSATYEEELYTTCYLLRDWPSARRHAARAEALAPSLPLLKVQHALVDLWQNADPSHLARVFASLPAYGDPEGNLTWMRWDAAMIGRDYGKAQAALDAFPFETLSSVYSAPIPKSYLEGCIALAQGDSKGALEKFEIARPALEAESFAHPADPLRHARLGLLYAYMGKKGEAIREGTRAVELQPVSEDAFDGPENLATLALIYARVGENGKAVEIIESLLRSPAGVFFYEASVSLSELRLRWQWDSLREDARFQALIAGSEPLTNY
ncbi:MAG: protein kinase domain-containing protein [Chthoniobacterales bacterium]